MIIGIIVVIILTDIAVLLNCWNLISLNKRVAWLEYEFMKLEEKKENEKN